MIGCFNTKAILSAYILSPLSCLIANIRSFKLCNYCLPHCTCKGTADWSIPDKRNTVIDYNYLLFAIGKISVTCTMQYKKMACHTENNRNTDCCPGGVYIMNGQIILLFPRADLSVFDLITLSHIYNTILTDVKQQVLLKTRKPYHIHLYDRSIIVLLYHYCNWLFSNTIKSA